MEAALVDADETLRAAPEGRADEPIRRAFESQQAKLRGFIRGYLREAADVDDILQEVFYDLIVAYRLMKPIGHVTAWLMRVARNRIIDRFRGRAREHRSLERSLESAGEAESERLLESFMLPAEPGPERAYARTALVEALEQAVAELPAEQRSIFVAHEIEGRSFKQLAAATGLSINTLLSRKHAAVQRLRRRLRDAYEGFIDYDEFTD